MPKSDITIEVGGRMLRLPPLSVAVLEEHEADYDLVLEAARKGRALDRELMNAACTLAHASLVLRHPEVTLREVKCGIATGDIDRLISALLLQSGFPEAKDAEGKVPTP